MCVWGGHSCPPPLTLILKWILGLDCLVEIAAGKIKSKSGGQECRPIPDCLGLDGSDPSHMAWGLVLAFFDGDDLVWFRWRTCCFNPLGHWISILSIFAIAPRPKCTRRSELDP